MVNAASDERLARLEAHVAIADLIHEYARLVRRDMPEGISDLFAPDGWFEIRDGEPDKPDHSVRERLDSPQAVHDYLLQGKGRAHPIPLIHNLQIEVTGETAMSNCVMEAQVYGTQIKVFGEYLDTFRRVDGRWLFASRTYTIYRGGSSV